MRDSRDGALFHVGCLLAGRQFRTSRQSEMSTYFFPTNFFSCGQVRVLATSALVSPARRACKMP